MNDQRVLIFPPSRRDGEVSCHVLRRAGLICRICERAALIAEELDAGAGAIVMTDTGLRAPDFDVFAAALARQAAWSDIPIVLLSGADATAVIQLPPSFANVTLLDRPASARTLISAVQAALRNRLRQYEMRDQIHALKVAEDTLRNADRRKDEFLAMLAHELRNPLAPIRNASELLTRISPDNPQLNAMAGIIKRQITQLSRLVDDLLDVSRITQGRIELQQLPVDLSAVIAQAMESVEPLIREHRHKAYLAVGYKPLYVKGDRARLVQCVANLLTNAAKYTDIGGEIRVDMREEAGTAAISVTDNGVGISDELLPKIFDLFVQSDRSLDRSQGGLGIGLSVVRQLIEMHGGRVYASSEGLGRGSKFELRLPLIPAPQAVDEDVQARNLGPKRILIVDDNVDAADSLAMVLSQSGHSAEAVFTPSEALRRAATFDPEVILLDIGLPGMDGYEVAKHIRAAGSAARLVALTGYGQPEDIRRTRAAGFDAHLVKPVDLVTLMRELTEQA